MKSIDSEPKEGVRDDTCGLATVTLSFCTCITTRLLKDDNVFCTFPGFILGLVRMSCIS